MRILIVGSFRWEMYAPAFFKAWKDLKHDVEYIDFETYSFKQKSPFSSLFNRIQSRFHYGFFMHKYNRDIITEVERFKPDLVFLYR